MVTKDSLLLAVRDASEALDAARAALAEFEGSPENNRFDDIKTAQYTIEDKLRDIAAADCEGSYNCGDDKYTQDYYVGDTLYRCTAEFEYNRHDKTYYYVDAAEYTHEVIG